ncbi:MAG: heme-binding protein [Chitinophagales bacterium]|nr:heme-binding protein [Chitinophagales bacterium]
MKYLLIVVIVVAIIVIAVQIYFTISMSKIETHHYTVISQKGNVEVRKYDPAIFINYTEKGGMFQVQNNAFRNLAGYLFGSNAREQKIAMTAPVQMEQKDNDAVMRFMIPSEYKLKDLPAPTNSKVLMTEEPAFYAAAIRYSGFNNESKFQKHKKQLEEFISNEKSELDGAFIFLGYNPPFQWFGRKNEVLVKIESIGIAVP